MQNRHFAFIHCVERLSLQGRHSAWANCFEMSRLGTTPIDCYNSGNGNEVSSLLFIYIKTASLFQNLNLHGLEIWV